ncbi:MAG: methyltransferase, partial [Deltaproteobacteria bacterium]|nr:methyltransferase [Deltaproteobacteria bacterium]
MTTDSLFNGSIRVKQHGSGYRFSLDAVLLARHARPSPDHTVLDLGTGCGIIPLILAYRHPKIKIYGVEVQTELADIATLNIAENHMENRITIYCKDLKRLQQDMTSGPVDLVVTNPPYRKLESGRLNPNHQRAVAKHEIKATLFDVVETARRMLRTSGRFVIIHAAERMVDIIIQMRSAGIEPKYIRMIHSSRQVNAKRIL